MRKIPVKFDLTHPGEIRINLDTSPWGPCHVRWFFALLVTVVVPVPGCTQMKDYTAVFEKYDFEYSSSGHQMMNVYEKNADNETVSSTTHVYELDFTAMTPRSEQYWIETFWMDPGDGSPLLTWDASDTSILSYDGYTGYGAFRENHGFIDSQGDEYMQWFNGSDRAPSHRSGTFLLTQTATKPPANLYVDAPHPTSLGPPERIMLTSEITNALDFIPQSTEITWTLVGPNGEVLGTHTEEIGILSSYTWEFYMDEDVPFGPLELQIESSVDTNINQDTEIKMSYNGFTCYAKKSNECSPDP